MKYLQLFAFLLLALMSVSPSVFAQEAEPKAKTVKELAMEQDAEWRSGSWSSTKYGTPKKSAPEEEEEIAEEEEPITPEQKSSLHHLLSQAQEPDEEGLRLNSVSVTSADKCFSLLEPEEAMDIRRHSRTPYGDCLSRLSEKREEEKFTKKAKKKKKKKKKRARVIEFEDEDEEEDDEEDAEETSADEEDAPLKKTISPLDEEDPLPYAPRQDNVEPRFPYDVNE